MPAQNAARRPLAPVKLAGITKECASLLLSQNYAPCDIATTRMFLPPIGQKHVWETAPLCGDDGSFVEEAVRLSSPMCSLDIL